MGAIERPILLDADSMILVHEWGVRRKIRKPLREHGCLTETIVNEAKYYKDRATNGDCRINLKCVGQTTAPRLVTIHDLTDDQYREYLEHFAALEQAGRGEREIFAMPWVLQYDVCSQDTNASELFRQHRPAASISRHVLPVDLLRKLKIAPS